MNDQRWILLGLLVGALGLAPAASAHFPWLATDDQGRALFFFGESLSDRTYHLPDKLAEVPVHQHVEGAEPKRLELQPVDSDALVGRRSSEPLAADGMVSCEAVYGIYHGTKLSYYAQHFPSSDPARWPNSPSETLPLQAVLAHQPDRLEVKILWQGKPQTGCEVKLFGGDGELVDSGNTDQTGAIRFAHSDLRSGLMGVLAGFVDKTASGTLGDKEYNSETHYLSATFFASGSAAAPSKETSSAADAAIIDASGLPDLPETLTSFGGAIADNVLYVYGGHTGDAHSYSTSEQSDRFYALDLRGESPQWQTLSSGPRLQGLALVPHGEDVIRVGGFTALNAEGQSHDLRSQASVSRFDVSSGDWQALPDLPEPRSSHDAAVLNDRLYVVGGWQLDGEEASRWHDTAWALDLSDASAEWKSITPPPTTRRALSLAAHDGKLYAIGGMKQPGGPTTVVEIYDPEQNQWTAGPELPGEPMNGFGNAAFAAGGSLYVTTIRGNALRLSTAGDAWEQVATVDPPRFFHRMLPHSDDALLIVGGANMAEGKYLEIDRLQIR